MDNLEARLVAMDVEELAQKVKVVENKLAVYDFEALAIRIEKMEKNNEVLNYIKADQQTEIDKLKIYIKSLEDKCVVYEHTIKKLIK